ncbi:hypothetical protein AAF712_007716 [Marasmius tenuissimus]|uniref:Uncharacterized protein n=1 Tax=Marasmius tenuissimus TaxID=585030 RepID=A0ABR2ZVC4_9AGAR|nr:hypothetical protein PM082_022757 [Marasmius tenuissimus]
MGPILISNASYTETLPIARAAGVPFYISKSVTSGYNYPPISLPNDNNTVVNVTRTPTPTAEQAAVVVLELAKYKLFWETVWQPKYSAIRYTNGVPKEFTVPMGQWLKSEGYQVLPIVIRQALALAGYDDLDKTPTIYGLQFLPPDILAYFCNVGQVNFIDFHAVMEYYAKGIHGKLLTSTTVTQLDRSGDTPIVSYVAAGSTEVKTQTCSHVVLAFPPLIEALTGTQPPNKPTNNSGVDIQLSSEEEFVFSRVGMTPYLSGAITAPKVPVNTKYSQLPTRNIGQPILATKSFDNSDVLTTYSWGPFDPYGRSDFTAEQAREILKQTYAAVDFGAASGVPGTSIRIEIKDEDFREFRAWDYFPRFQSEDLAGGIYDKFNEIQGYKKTYWVSGLNSFELVEYALRAGKEIVGTFF